MYWVTIFIANKKVKQFIVSVVIGSIGNNWASHEITGLLVVILILTVYIINLVLQILDRVLIYAGLLFTFKLPITNYVVKIC